MQTTTHARVRPPAALVALLVVAVLGGKAAAATKSEIDRESR